MPNADQCWSMSIIILALIPMSIYFDQCRSMLINAGSSRMFYWCLDWSALICIERNWSELIGINRQWSALRDISDQCHDFNHHWSALIGIDWESPVHHAYDSELAFFRSSPGWSDAGCEVSSYNNTFVQCQCTHLTDFAVILSPDEVNLTIVFAMC